MVLLKRCSLRAAQSLRSPSHLRLSPVIRQARFAGSDYGSPTHKDDPASDPKNQGPNPSADKEHPGPPPPKVGQDTGLSGTKKGAQGHNTNTQQSDVRPSVGNEPTQPSGKKSFSTMTARRYADAPQPKILNESPPSEDQAPEDVRKHNEEFRQRADTPHEKVKEDAIKDDKVNKGYWKTDKDIKREG